METKNYTKSYFDTINERFSCRSFKDEMITDEELDIILNAGLLAPTAVNYQPQKIYVVKDKELVEKLKEASRFTFDSKTILVVTYDENISWHRKRDNKDHGEIDSTICATQMMLAATALGLGTCYVCSMKEEMVKEILSIPQNERVNCMLPLGYPTEILKHNTRKDLKEIVVYK